MRLLILDTCYPAFLRAHYSRHPGLEQKPYAEQWRALMDTFFGTADSYSHALGQLGHDAHEVIANSSALQTAWLREHGPRLPIPFRLDRERTVLRQAADYRPDVIYVQNMRFFSSRLLRKLRKLGVTLVGQVASEPPSPRRVGLYDLVLTSFPHFVDRFRRLGVKAEYFRIGFEPRVLEMLAHLEAQPAGRHQAVFVGALNRTQHASGNALLERAARRAPLEFWGYGGATWPRESTVRTRYHGEAWGIEMFRVLYESRIAVNRHIGVAERWANNMRLFEATGVGTLLVTDAKENLGQLFAVDREVVTYANEDELVHMINYYLEHEEERAEIARAGQERTLREHTYLHRMRELVAMLTGSAA